jgi:hypothetical protein
VQVHSLRFHGDPEGWDGTVMSDGILVEHGVVVLGVTPRSLRSRPEAVLRRIEQVHALARRRPRPAVEAVPVGHGVASS